MAMNPPCVIVGHDVALYTIQGYGPNCNPGPNGEVITLLGRWKTINVEAELNWADVTPSSATWVTRRLLNLDWRATLENQIQVNGSVLMFDMFSHNGLVQVFFQEATAGGVFKLTGGISRVTYRGERGEFVESMEIVGAGDILGDGFPFYYGTASGVPAGLAAGAVDLPWSDAARKVETGFAGYQNSGVLTATAEPSASSRKATKA